MMEIRLEIGMESKNIILIGMPSAGKSTIGKLISKSIGKSFIDTDTIIKEKANKPLRDIVNTDGLAKFLEIQESTILDMKFEDFIIATGGSVVYSDTAMNHLKNKGIIIYLKLEYRVIEERVTPDRRFARSTEQSLLQLYNERVPLYEKYADITIECSNLSEEEIINNVLNRLQK
jgi:shikimate kinase